MLRHIKAIAIIALIAIISAGCGMGAAMTGEEETRMTPVIVTAVTKGDLTVMNEMIGVVTPEKQVAVIPEVSGRLQDVHVAKGDYVEAGQVLASIDTHDLQLGLQLEQTGLNIARTQLESALSRQRQAEDTAKNAMRQGQDSVQITENVRQATIAVEQARASVQQAELRVQQAQDRLARAQVKAPISGEILSIGAEPGEMVSVQSPLFTIISAKSPKVTASISAEQMKLLQINDEVTVAVPSLNTEIEGVVSFVSMATGQNGLYTLEVSLPNPPAQLRSGMSGIVRVEETAVADALLVPTSAVVERGESDHVFVVEDGVAREQEIQIIVMQSDVTAVAGDLKEGELIVTKGQLTLKDGSKVSLIEEGLE